MLAIISHIKMHNLYARGGILSSLDRSVDVFKPVLPTRGERGAALAWILHTRASIVQHLLGDVTPGQVLCRSGLETTPGQVLCRSGLETTPGQVLCSSGLET